MPIHLASVIHLEAPNQDETEYILTPITLWPLGTIDSVHVLPGWLNLECFKTAVGVAAGLVRGVAGRYGRRTVGNTHEYFISLRDMPIPIKHVSGANAPVFAASLDVVRDDLGPYIDKIDLAHQRDSEDAALLKIKITEQRSGQTVVGICWGHILGNGASFNLFTTYVSDVYAHLSTVATGSTSLKLSGLDLPTPTTTHLSFTPPSSSLLELHGIPQTESLSIAEGSRLYGEGMQGEKVVFRLSAEDTVLLKGIATGNANAGTWVSTQDALSAWFVEVLREACGEEIDTVTNSINYRSLPTGPSALFPVPLTHLIGNVAQMMATRIPPPSASPRTLSRTAHALRADLASLRADPQRTYDWLSVCADRLGRAADEDRMMCVLPRKGDVFVNSNLRYDWNVLFGFPPGSTSYHTLFSGHHMLRVFQPNPSSATAGPITRGSAELIFNVRADLKDKTFKIMESDRATGWAKYKPE